MRQNRPGEKIKLQLNVLLHLAPPLTTHDDYDDDAHF